MCVSACECLCTSLKPSVRHLRHLDFSSGKEIDPHCVIRMSALAKIDSKGLTLRYSINIEERQENETVTFARSAPTTILQKDSQHYDVTSSSASDNGCNIDLQQLQ